MSLRSILVSLFRKQHKTQQGATIVPLKELEIKQKGIVRRIGRGGALSRLIDMGVVPGTIIEVKGFAPLGDPVEIELKGYRLLLRKEEAEQIMVEII